MGSSPTETTKHITTMTPTFKQFLSEQNQTGTSDFVKLLEQYLENTTTEVVAMIMGKWKAERDAKNWFDNSDMVIPIFKQAMQDVKNIIEEVNQLKTEAQKQKRSRIMMRNLVAKWHRGWKQLERFRDRSRAKYTKNFRKYSSEIDAYYWLEKSIGSRISGQTFATELWKVL